MSEPFNWIGNLIGLIRDETTPGGSLICDSVETAIVVEDHLKRHGIKCYYAGSDAVTGEAAVRVLEEDIYNAQKLCSVPVLGKKAQPSCFTCVSLIFGIIILVIGCYVLLAAQAISGAT